MGFLSTRVRAVSTFIAERVLHGGIGASAPDAAEIVVVLDGVGGFQFAPLIVRRALRLERVPIRMVAYPWQYGLPGEIWTDLCWLRRNRVMGARLARKLLTIRRDSPETVIHMVAFSGGAGIAAFACESLRGRAVIETLLLVCPALSPQYCLAPALSAVRRAYALISQRDRWILGVGTRLFGTTDRCFTPAAGQVGFRIPAGVSDQDRALYDKMRQILWTPDLKRVGHFGGHTTWASIPFLREHLVPILHGNPALQATPVPSSVT